LPFSSVLLFYIYGITWNVDVPGTVIDKPLGIVNGLIIIADTLAPITTFAESVRGVAIAPFTNICDCDITTTLPVPLMPMVTLPLAVVIATLDVPLTMA
jgi:hypothetical protein